MIGTASMGGRKFIVAMTVILVTAGLVAFRIVDQVVYSSVMLAVVGAYLTANVAQKRLTSQPPEPPA